MGTWLQAWFSSISKGKIMVKEHRAQDCVLKSHDLENDFILKSWWVNSSTQT